MSEWVEEPIQGEILYYDKVTFVRGGRQILRGVNWQIKDGQRWALLGRNGAGKSTLLSMIPAYTFPTRGTMRVLGYTFGKYAWKTLRNGLVLLALLWRLLLVLLLVSLCGRLCCQAREIPLVSIKK